MIKVICLKSIGNFILLPPPMSVCVFVLKYFSAENLDEDESQLLLIIKFTLLGSRRIAKEIFINGF